MPGTFAHLTLIEMLCNRDRLKTIDTLDAELREALLLYTDYCRLGAVSPDYPYLSLGDCNAEGWANGMHYFHSADFVRKAVVRLANYNYRDAAPQKEIAWLFGFVSHVVADASMHPVINGIVGDYVNHKKEHRRCEAHQDAYVFTDMELGDIDRDKYIDNCGLESSFAGHRLDPDVTGLWNECLQVIRIGSDVKEGVRGPTAGPNIDHWHLQFLAALEEVSDILPHIPLISRVFDKVLGVGYPEPRQIDDRYIHGLPTPGGGTKDYEKLFCWMLGNTKLAWRNLGEVLEKRDEALLSLPNADMDTGMDSSGQSIYWKEPMA